MTHPSAEVEVRAELPTDATVVALLALLDDALRADGVPAMSEQAILRLRHGAEATEHLVAREPDGLPVGYLQLADEGDATIGELVVRPQSRRQGVGSALAAAAGRPGAGRAVRVWAHGNTPAAAAMAVRAGFEPRRVLLQLRRPAATPLPAAVVAPGVTIRAFRPGPDDEAWVRVNSRAFADHPEQGRLTVADLRDRMAEPWFDPAGFFVATRDTADGTDRLVGFHWTKVHEVLGHLGEVYVVGVDPDERGNRLGLALTITGLEHLVARGVPTFMLYADESNAGAVRMYERLGFTVASTDVMYERTAPG